MMLELIQDAKYKFIESSNNKEIAGILMNQNTFKQLKYEVSIYSNTDDVSQIFGMKIKIFNHIEDYIFYIVTKELLDQIVMSLPDEADNNLSNET